MFKCKRHFLAGANAFRLMLLITGYTAGLTYSQDSAVSTVPLSVKGTASTPATADNAATEDLLEMSLEDLLNIEVTTASKTAQKISQAPSNITVITAEQIREWGCRDLKDLLKRVPGFAVIADRDEWVFGIRGNVADNNLKYLIMVDGHRVNSIENFGPGQIIELPNNLSSVKRIEVIRGPGSAVWGPDALAGVVNIITKNVDDLANSTYHVSVRPGLSPDKEDGKTVYRKSATIDLQVGRKIGDDAEIMLMASGGYSDGDLITQSGSTRFGSYPADTKTPLADTVSLDTAVVPGRLTTMLDKHAPSYMLQCKARVGEFSLNALSFNASTYNRQWETGLGRENYLVSNKVFVEGAWQKEVIENLDVAVKLSSDLNRAEYQPMTQDTSTLTQTDIVWLDRKYTASLDANFLLLQKLTINLGIEGNSTQAGPNQRINGIRPDSSQKNATGLWVDPFLKDYQVGGYLIAEFSPVEWLTLLGGTRCDVNNQRGNDPVNFNPRFAAIYQPTDIFTLKLLGNWGYLRPANFQSAYAKDSIASEKMREIDLIGMVQLENINFSLNLFMQDLEGFINLFPGNYQFRNTANYHAKGAELEVSAAIASHSVWGNVSYTHATADNFNAAMAYNNRRADLKGVQLNYPAIMANIGGTVRFMNKSFWCSPHMRIVGPTKYRTTLVKYESHDSESYYATTPTFAYVNLAVGYVITKNLELSVYLDNIANVTEPTHQSVWNGTIDQTGFSLAGKISVMF